MDNELLSAQSVEASSGDSGIKWISKISGEIVCITYLGKWGPSCIDLLYHGWVGENDCPWTNRHDGTIVLMQTLNFLAGSAIVRVKRLGNI